MSSKHSSIKTIIKKVLSEDREPLKDILDHVNTADVAHATHLAMDGGEKGGVEAENLVMPIDHAAAAGSEKVTKSIEVIDPATNKVVSYEERGFKLSEAEFRKSIRNILLKVL